MDSVEELNKNFSYLENLLDKQNFILEELIKSEEIQEHSQEVIEAKLQEIHDSLEKMQFEFSQRPSPNASLDRHLEEINKKLDKPQDLTINEAGKKFIQLCGRNIFYSKTVIELVLLISILQGSLMIWLAYKLVQ